MTHPSAQPTSIRTQADLTAMWEAALAPCPGDATSLSLAFFDPDADRAPAVVCIDDVPDRPDASDAEHLSRLAREVQEHVGVPGVAAALVRGGPDRVGAADRAWVRCLAERAGLTRQWPVHLVTPAGARVVAADDLLGPLR